MDLNFLYSDFVMDDKEVLFHSAPGTVSSFHDGVWLDEQRTK